MMMPCQPAPYLVLTHTHFLFGILEGTFHKIPLGLHLHQLCSRILPFAGIAESIFYFHTVGCLCFADNQQPLTTRCCSFFPSIYLSDMGPAPEHPFCSLPDVNVFP